MPMRISIANSKSFLKTLPPGAEYFTAALEYATPVVGVTNASAVEGEHRHDLAANPCSVNLAASGGWRKLNPRRNGELNVS